MNRWHTSQTAVAAEIETPGVQHKPRKRRSSEPKASPLRVGVVGCGYWGPNLMRNFASCPATRLVAACDADSSRLQPIGRQFPATRLLNDFNSLLDDPQVDAVAVATPVGTHAALASAALDAGKHVLVEKPLADSSRAAEQLVAKAAERCLTLMVDHTYIYSPAVVMIKQLIDDGELGDLYFIDSVRINLGLFQRDVNVVWDLAVHDLAIIDFLLGRLPRSMSAAGSCHVSGELEDVAHLNLDFGRSLPASVHVNWLSPVKLRRLMIGGSRRSLIYNDLDRMEPVKIYDRGVQLGETLEERTGLRVSYRTGDVWSPHVQHLEPLQCVASHFEECVRTGRQPTTGGEEGLRVVRILEAAQRSIKAQGGRITL